MPEKPINNIIETGKIDGHEYWIAKHPIPRLGGLNGYVVFADKPVKESGYGGILTYVPVHGGITYAEKYEAGIVYGFDTGHYRSEEEPREDCRWIKGQCQVMLRAILLAAELEDEYLLAEGDNEKRADICQRILDVAPEAELNTMTILGALCGRL